MLQAIRNKAHGILAWIILILIGVPFALWGIQNYIDTGREKPMAVVGGTEIFERDVNRVYEQSLANLVGLGQFDEGELKREALERLVREELIGQNAVDFGMAIGDDDVRGFIQTLPYFQTDGKFDNEKYALMLNSQGISKGQFVAQIRKALTLEQYQRGVSDTAFVTQQQLDDFYRVRNQQRQIEYLTVPLKKFDGEISNEQIETYYRENLATFRTPQRVSVEYLTIDIDSISDSIQPSEEDLKALYEEQKNQALVAERRKISHILVANDTNGTDADERALEKARQLKERIGKGEDFAKLAQSFSDDQSSAKQGGDLGFITKDSMDPNFTEQAFSLPVGALSDPVRTPFGYHLIKVVEIDTPKNKTFEEIRAELTKSLQKSVAENKYYEMGQILTEQGFEHPDSLDPAAKRLGLQIQQTGFFTRDHGDGAAAEEAFRKAAFNDDVLEGRNSEPVELANNKVFLMRLKDQEPASDKPLSEVKNEIISRLREAQAREVTRKEALRLADMIAAGKTIKEVAKASGVSLVSPGLVSRNQEKLPVPLLNATFKAARPVGDRAVSGTVGMENGDQIVFQVLSVQDGVLEKVDSKELDLARDFLLKNLGQSELVAYLKQLRAEGDVYIPARE